MGDGGAHLDHLAAPDGEYTIALDRGHAMAASEAAERRQDAATFAEPKTRCPQPPAFSLAQSHRRMEMSGQEFASRSQLGWLQFTYLLLLLPSLSSWVQFTAQAAGQLGATPMLRG